jgi:hypothetical protein
LIGLDVLLADSVSAAEGKLHAQGAGWNRVIAQRLPTVHGRIGLGIVLRVPSDQTGTEHAIEVRLEDPDGTALQRIGGSFRVDAPEHGAQDEEVLPVALNVDSVALEREGTYRFVIAIDGEDARAVPFAVQAAASNSTS